MDKWLIFNVGLISFCGLSPLFTPSGAMGNLQMSWAELGVIFISFPIMMVVALFVMVVIRKNTFKWQIPSLKSSPFNLSQPEQFFYVGSFCTVFSGVGSLINELYSTGTFSLTYLAPIALGVGIWCGLKILNTYYLRKVADCL